MNYRASTAKDWSICHVRVRPYPRSGMLSVLHVTVEKIALSLSVHTTVLVHLRSLAAPT